MKNSNIKEFFLSSWATENRTAVYIITAIIALAGFSAYNNLPKEQFPEVKIPNIIVQTFYPGTSPENMENLVTKPIEKQAKNLSGVKKITSNSFQDFSVVIVEFNTDVKTDQAKVDVKDAVDKARPDMPQNLPNEPEVKDIDLSEMPILYVNISGKYDLNRLKTYAEDIQDKIEMMKEVKRVDLVGALDREIQINVDLYKMQAAGITFSDISNTVAAENISATAGQVSMNNQKRNITIRNEFQDAREIGSVILTNSQGGTVYLRDIAEIKDDFEDQESYARMNNGNVITLNIIKAKGENLIEASDKIRVLLAEMQQSELPQDLAVNITGDQSEKTRVTLHDLINTIIIGFLLVTLILMFFMGVTNAVFVALSVPLSCAIAFMVLPVLGFTLNMIVLFSFLLALGIVVDDAIVVIENTHRMFGNGRMPIKQAAKLATGEVFLPVLSGTATTLMPFVPLAFWPGVIGSFMFYLPITLIVTLIASLLVSYVINPVFAVDFMKVHDPNDTGKRKFGKKDKYLLIGFAVAILLSYLSGWRVMGGLLIFLYLFILLEKFVLERLIYKFQHNTWPAFQRFYGKWLERCLLHPGKTLLITVGIFIFTIVLVSVRGLDFTFFAKGEPNFIYVYLNMPVGTDQAYTNEVVQKLEGRVNKALDIRPDHPNPAVSSIISNVTVGAVDPGSGEVGNFPNKGRIQVAFVEYSKRTDVNTNDYLEKIRAAVKDVPGAEVTVDKESSGPPLAKPVVVNITGDNLDTLAKTSVELQKYLAAQQIPGVEELRSDFQISKPEIIFELDRERMNQEGITTGAVARTLGTAVFGQEISRFRDQKDDYPIRLRLPEDQRENVEAIRNMPITFRSAQGMVKSVPISAFADVRYSNSYGGIKRLDQKRIISLSSNVLTGFDENKVVASVQAAIDNYKLPVGIDTKMGGQQEDQAETMGFLGSAGIAAISLIFLILILQFNSLSRTLIIMSAIVMSIFGVFLGLGLFGTTFSLVFSGIGIIALMGVVVRNGILLVEFMDLMLAEGLTPMDAIMEAGRTRMTPVILTATAAILGLIPLAIGLNMDFATLFSHLNPHIYFGGDSASFWGPLAWAMIYGLFFATFLTLLLVPVLMLLSFKLKIWIAKKRGKPSPFATVSPERVEGVH